MTHSRLFAVVGLIVVAIVALAAFAGSDAPDGLESVAAEQGFAEEADDHALDDSPISDYAVDGIDGGTSKLLAGVLGALVTFAIGYGWFKLAARRKRGANHT